MQLKNKKRVIFLSVFTLLPIFVASIGNSENAIKSKTIDTMAMPVTAKTIVIDARTPEVKMVEL